MARRKKNKVIDRDKGYKVVLKNLRAIEGRLEVGFVEGLSSPESARKSAINENGAPDIPPRPHISKGFDDRRTQALKAAAKAGAVNLLKGRKAAGEAAMEAAAMEILAGQRAAIVFMTNPRNADATIRRKGFNDPLVETGDMSRDLAWRTRNAKGHITGGGKFDKGSR